MLLLPPRIYQTNGRRLQSFLSLPVPTNSFQSMNLNRRRLNRSCNRRAVVRVLMITAAAANTKPSFFPRRVSEPKKESKETETYLASFESTREQPAQVPNTASQPVIPSSFPSVFSSSFVPGLDELGAAFFFFFFFLHWNR